MERIRTEKSSQMHYDQKLTNLKNQLKDLSKLCLRML